MMKKEGNKMCAGNQRKEPKAKRERMDEDTEANETDRTSTKVWQRENTVKRNMGEKVPEVRCTAAKKS